MTQPGDDPAVGLLIPKMKIAISSIGRFHMLDLARQMMRLKQEVRLYTGLPLWKVDSDLRPVAQTRPFWVAAEYLRWRLPPLPKTTWWADRALEDFGPWLAGRIDNADVLDALAGTGLEAGRALHETGKVWVCNRGSSHILTQKQLLEEECARWGAPPPFFSREGLARCRAEYAEADAVVVPSEFSRRSFLEHGYPPDRLFKCPYGIDLTLFSPRPQVEERRRFRVVSVGGCSLRKGIGYLFQALRPLVTSGVVETWLIGSVSPEARPILKAHAGEFQYWGSQPRARLAGYLSRCDVMALVSIEEGLALVLAQAMACGLPVIATKNTGAEDLFKDGIEGFLVPIRDPGAIRQKIQWMLDNPTLCKGMGAAALQNVKNLGGWDSYGRQCLDMYRQLLTRKGLLQ